MGDRVLFVVTDNQGTIPEASIYGHWSGERAMRCARELAEYMADRPGDVSYASARMAGILHVGVKGPLSVGLMPAPASLDPDTLRNESHGDAGVILINCSTWKAQGFGGYWDKYGEVDLSGPLPNLED